MSAPLSERIQRELEEEKRKAIEELDGRRAAERNAYGRKGIRRLLRNGDRGQTGYTFRCSRALKKELDKHLQELKRRGMKSATGEKMTRDLCSTT